ncbi:exported protein of unknown function [Tenacibaculum sp. 190524A02b]|uniref:hypothetical protein n=1 Tax=Tenacibaculum vairaonense TaxID=3137860 RepID=UPI0032B160F7
MKSKLLVIAMVGIAIGVNAQTYKNPDTNTDYNHFIRDGGGAAVYINQASTDETKPILRLSSGTTKPNTNVKFTVENNGNIGIGTNNPTEGKLVIAKHS